MSESLGVEFIQDILTYMAERGVSQVVAQGNGFCQVLVEVEGSTYGAGYLRYLQGVGKAGYIMVSRRSDKNLGFMLQPPKSLAVNYAVAVTLKDGAYRAR